MLLTPSLEKGKTMSTRLRQLTQNQSGKSRAHDNRVQTHTPVLAIQLADGRKVELMERYHPAKGENIYASLAKLFAGKLVYVYSDPDQHGRHTACTLMAFGSLRETDIVGYCLSAGIDRAEELPKEERPWADGRLAQWVYRKQNIVREYSNGWKPNTGEAVNVNDENRQRVLRNTAK